MLQFHHSPGSKVVTHLDESGRATYMVWLQS